jgi:sulfur carrier protein ThiS
MTVMLRLHPALRSYVEGKPELTAAPGASVRAVLSDAGIPVELVAAVIVNDEQRDKDYVLQAGDRVRLLAVIGGG